MKSCEKITIVAKPLAEDDSRRLADFSCGNHSIDLYLKLFAMNDKTAVTYLFLDEEADAIISFATISCSAIFNAESEETQFSTLFSAIEIKYFATDSEYQHIPCSSEPNSPSLSNSIFTYLLMFLRGISRSTIGASKIVLYAVPSAVNFYKRHGFTEFAKTMYGDRGTFLEGCIPMCREMEDE